MTDSDASHVYMDPKPEQMGETLIDIAGGALPLWDGVSLPKLKTINPKPELNVWMDGWLNMDNSPRVFGQPPRQIRVTLKVSRAQMLGQSPITKNDIVPNE